MRRSAAKKAWKLAGSITSLAILVFALWLLQRALGKYEFSDIAARLGETSWVAIAAALGATCGSYLALGGFDWLATRYIGRDVPLGRVMMASFVSHAVSHSAGFAALTGGAIRYRMYAAAGLTALEVAKVIVFCGLTFMVGACTLAALALLMEPSKFAALTGFGEPVLRVSGAAILGLVAAYLMLGALRRRPWRMFGRSFVVPPLRVGLRQILVSAVDLGFAATALYVLLPVGAPTLWAMIGIYVLANLAGLVTHVPGGLGVFETAVVLMLPEVPPDATLGALVLFRVTYNLVPLALGALILIAFEVLSRRRSAVHAARLVTRELEPTVLAFLVFSVGAMLLVTGAVPENPARMATLQAWPAPVVQGSHLVASAAGAGLLLVARGIFRRLAGAYRAALLLLVLGGAAAMMRALDYEEATACAALTLALVVSRRGFYRRQSVAALGYSSGWTVAAAAIVIATAWLTVLAFRRETANLDIEALLRMDEAGRALRAAVAAMGVFAAGLLLSVRRRVVTSHLPDAGQLAAAAAIIAATETVAGCRALSGGHHLMFDGRGEAFIMYRRNDAFWVALGEPVGPRNAWLDLAWRFREACEAAGASPVFFLVPSRTLYLDLGLTFAGIGERGRVELAQFSLADPQHAELRQVHASVQRSGLQFEMMAVGTRPDLDPSGRFPMAVARQAGGELVAASPLWQAGGELALADVRLLSAAPQGIDDFMAVEVMLWAQHNGGRGFEFDPLPLDPADPLLDKLARLAGRPWSKDLRLRQKYRAQWFPLHAAVPPGLTLPAGAKVLTASPRAGSAHPGGRGFPAAIVT